MKRIFDLIIVVLLAPVWVPLLLAVALMVRLFLGSPVLFRQRRPGFRGKPFEILKFRSMTDERDDKGELLPDELRITRFSRWLRSSSLDELPELINVLKGEMALVGPRPLLMQYLPLYTARQSLRHEARPGITGWAQINGRNALSWEEKLEMDAWYVENQSLWLDTRILILTLVKVIAREGINTPGAATAPLFQGSASKD